MAEEVENLIVAPFKEIVEKGSSAIQNAHDGDEEAAAPMLKAAQNLVKEGERALKRIEPLCATNYEQYGSNFVDAIKENDEIAQYRSELEDLLWDFDDYIEVDAFDAEKYDELQKASRKAAPKIVDQIKRMKLVAPEKPAALVAAQEAAPLPPTPLSPTPTSPMPVQMPVSPTGIVVQPPSGPLDEDEAMREVAYQLSSMMGAQSGPDEGFDALSEMRPASRALSKSSGELNRQTSTRSAVSSITSETPSEPPPRPPSADPWQVGTPPMASPSEYSIAGGARLERRPPVPDDSPTLPTAALVTPVSPPTARNGGNSRLTFGPDDMSNHGPAEDSERRRAGSLRSNSSRRGYNMYGLFPQSDSRHASRTISNPNTSSWSGMSSNGSATDESSRPSRPQSSASSNFANPHPPIPEEMPVNRGHIINSHMHPSPLATIPDYPERQASLNPGRFIERHPSQDSVASSVLDFFSDGASTAHTATTRNSVAPSTTPSSPYSPMMGVQSPQSPPPNLTPPQFPPLPRLPVAVQYPNIATASIPPASSAQIQTTTPVQAPSPALPTHNGFAINNLRINTSNSNHASMVTLTPTVMSPGQPGLEPVNLPMGTEDSGLIPVESEADAHPNYPTRVPDCTIGPHSSYYQMKGFCKGAEEAMAGGLGFKRIKRPLGSYQQALIAKCTHCLYELEFKAVEKDLNNDPDGNYVAQSGPNSINWRLRLLQKSHMVTKHVDEQMYACHICVSQGRTSEESDATVFFNQKQFFSHLARHARPIPAVQGLTILEGDLHDMPPNYSNNFDLHFPNPPAASVMPGIMPEVSRLPTAIATETRKIQYGTLHLPPDRQNALQYCVGAKIVGIEFPAKYEGRWAIGWHDGVRGAIEVDTIRLVAPPQHEIRLQNTSGTQAVARWKWSHKGEGNWLKFDKGDVIKNIGWVYTDHWCWSGTTSKGWGVFPQSHIEPNTIKTIDPSDKASIISSERKGLRGFNLRRAATNKSDSSNSSPTLSRVNIY